MLISDQLTDFCKSEDNAAMRSQKRLFVVKTLEKLGESVTAEDLWIAVRSGGLRIGFPSIYKILNWLILNDFVMKAGKKEGRVLYTLSR